MSHRWMLAGVITVALLASGCSGGKTTITQSPKSSSASASASSSESTEASDEPTTEAQEPLGSDACVEVTQANLDLALASTSADAQKAADVFDKYNPPAPVQEAIDHFVETNGPQIFDDDKYKEYDARITNWVKAVCPL